jgi:ssDNA-binding Zn-finger/Zn-ribbon topoisomerase 1
MIKKLEEELKLECPECKKPRIFTYVGMEGENRVYSCSSCLYCIEIKPTKIIRLKT